MDRSKVPCFFVAYVVDHDETRLFHSCYWCVLSGTYMGDGRLISLLTGVRLLAVITLQTLWWVVGGQSGSWN